MSTCLQMKETAWVMPSRECRFQGYGEVFKLLQSFLRGLGFTQQLHHSTTNNNTICPPVSHLWTPASTYQIDCTIDWMLCYVRKFFTCFTCSGFDIPKPTATGFFVTCRGKQIVRRLSYSSVANQCLSNTIRFRSPKLCFQVQICIYCKYFLIYWLLTYLFNFLKESLNSTTNWCAGTGNSNGAHLRFEQYISYRK